MLPITYIIVLRNEDLERYTHFQGFTRGTVRASFVVHKIVSEFPATTGEVVSSLEEIISSRVHSGSSYLIVKGAISQLHMLLSFIPEDNHLPIVLLSEKDLINEVVRQTSHLDCLIVAFDVDEKAGFLLDMDLKRDQVVEYLAAFAESKGMEQPQSKRDTVSIASVFPLSPLRYSAAP